jgi:hypothetical protein
MTKNFKWQSHDSRVTFKSISDPAVSGCSKGEVQAQDQIRISQVCALKPNDMSARNIR